MSTGNSLELASVRQVHSALSNATTLVEVKELRDKAEAVRQNVRSARAGLTDQNLAAEAKLRAERKAGEMLAALKRVMRLSLCLERLAIYDACSAWNQRTAT